MLRSTEAAIATCTFHKPGTRKEFRTNMFPREGPTTGSSFEVCKSCRSCGCAWECHVPGRPHAAVGASSETRDSVHLLAPPRLCFNSTTSPYDNPCWPPPVADPVIRLSAPQEYQEGD